ncbi:hypothetical protein JXB11_03385 [Candidatus Woesearchaeota archaeon]|nr:hypothetical protein [Candidatus Woesearchaeota archaeon]
MTLALIFGIAMGIGNFFNDHTVRAFKKVLGEVTSFVAGVSVTYVFMLLFPEFVERAFESYHPSIFLSILIGFSIFHIIEKYIYQKAPKKKRFRDLAIEDSAISFIYHLIIGILLFELTSENLLAGALFFFPVFLHTSVHALPVDITKVKAMKLFLATGTLWGVLLAAYICTPPHIVTTALIGFVIGALIFSVIRHALPAGEAGRPVYFIVGVLLYSLVILLTWL